VKFVLVLRGEYQLSAFDGRVPKDILGPNREEVIEGRRRLRHKQLYGLNASTIIIRLRNSRKVSLVAQHVTRMGRRKCTHCFGKKPRRKRDHVENAGVEWIKY
jgi:hypothetical protein